MGGDETDPWNRRPRVVDPGAGLAIERRAAVAGISGAQHEDDVLVGPEGPELITGAA
jgi:hypothetical protein